LAVKDAGADFGVLLAQVFAGLFVERDEAGGIGRRNVRVVQSWPLLVQA